MCQVEQNAFLIQHMWEYHCVFNQALNQQESLLQDAISLLQCNGPSAQSHTHFGLAVCPLLHIIDLFAFNRWKTPNNSIYFFNFYHTSCNFLFTSTVHFVFLSALFSVPHPSIHHLPPVWKFKNLVHLWLLVLTREAVFATIFPSDFMHCKSLFPLIHPLPFLFLLISCNPQTPFSCFLCLSHTLASPSQHKANTNTCTPSSPSPSYSRRSRPSQRCGAEGRAPVWSSFPGTAPPSGPGPHPAAAAHSRCGPWSCCGESCCSRWRSLCGESQIQGIWRYIVYVVRYMAPGSC